MTDILALALRVSIGADDIIRLLMGGMLAYLIIVIAQKIRDWRRK